MSGEILAANALEEVERLRTAIRKHMNYKGDERCYLDDHDLYLVLPEGDTRDPNDSVVTIENCQNFIRCRQTHLEYVSPQERIEELQKENADLKSDLLIAAERIGIQSQTITKMLEEQKREPSKQSQPDAGPIRVGPPYPDEGKGTTGQSEG